MEDTERDRNWLDKSASQYHNKIIKGWEKLYLKKRERLYEIFKRYQRPGQALELGSADGVMTERFCRDFESVTVIDGSAVFLNQVRKKIKAGNLRLVHSLFEEYVPSEKFDTVFMSHILEHMNDPVKLLLKARDWLAPEGRILISVPNANSLHRFVGVKMGLLESCESLNDQDIILGHKRVYTPDLLKKHVADGGLHVVKFGGLMIKPLTNRQIEAQWSEELINAYFAVSDDLPELCSEIYVIAERRG